MPNAPAVIVRDPSKIQHPGKPPGYSYQTRRVHTSWSDMERCVAEMGEKRGTEYRLERDFDGRKLRGTRYSRCCDSVQVKGEPCRSCGHPVGYK